MKSGHPRDWSCDQAMNSLSRSFRFSGGPIFSARVECRLEAKWVSATQQGKDSIVLPFDTYRWDEELCDSLSEALWYLERSPQFVL